MDDLDHTGPDGNEQPDSRATIGGRRLTIVPWHPGLLRPLGYAHDQFRARNRAGVCIADLTILRVDEDAHELVVDVLSDGRTDALDVLVEWAGAVGYRRVWLPDRVLELDGAASIVGGRVHARCPSCRSRWEDGAPEFWLAVRQWGKFPAACPLCGGDLPQWEAVKPSASPLRSGVPGGATPGGVLVDRSARPA